MDQKTIKIIYCMGSGRSGSTLLGILLSKVSNVASCGELTGFSDIIIKKDTCACGEYLEGCKFWSEVWAELLNYKSEADLMRLIKLTNEMENMKSFSAWRRAVNPTKKQKVQHDEYNDFVYLLFSSIQKVSKKEVVADISKNPLRAFLLFKNPKLDLRIIHLSRDARGVAWSLYKRKKQKRKVPPIWRSAIFWVIVNTQADWIRKKHASSSSVWLRYEDFVQNPDDFINSVASLSEIGTEEMKNTLAGEFSNDDLHMVAGNKLRKMSTIRLKMDTEWIENMPKSKKRTVKFLAYTKLKKYGYC